MTQAHPELVSIKLGKHVTTLQETNSILWDIASGLTVSKKTTMLFLRSSSTYPSSTTDTDT